MLKEGGCCGRKIHRGRGEAEVNYAQPLWERRTKERVHVALKREKHHQRDWERRNTEEVYG